MLVKFRHFSKFDRSESDRWTDPPVHRFFLVGLPQGWRRAETAAEAARFHPLVTDANQNQDLFIKFLHIILFVCDSRINENKYTYSYIYI